MTTAVSIFDVEGTAEEVQIIKDAVAAIRPDVLTFIEKSLPRHNVIFVDDIKPTPQGIHPEALYPGNKSIKLNREVDNTTRMKGNFIHEICHGLDKYVIGADKEQKIMQLFVPVPSGWRQGFADYWKVPYESLCDWWVRVATDGRIISHWESKRLLIPVANRPKILPIIMSAQELPTPALPGVDPAQPEEEEMPLTQVVELQRGNVPAGTPILHPVTHAVLFTSTGNDSSKLMGVTPDGKYRGIVIVSKKIPGNGWKIAHVEASKVQNIRIEDPSVQLKAELDAANAEIVELNAHVTLIQDELNEAEAKAADDVLDAKDIVARHV